MHAPTTLTTWIRSSSHGIQVETFQGNGCHDRARTNSMHVRALHCTRGQPRVNANQIPRTRTSSSWLISHQYSALSERGQPRWNMFRALLWPARHLTHRTLGSRVQAVRSTLRRRRAASPVWSLMSHSLKWWLGWYECWRSRRKFRVNKDEISIWYVKYKLISLIISVDKNIEISSIIVDYLRYFRLKSINDNRR